MDYQIDHTNDYFQKGFQLYLLGRYADARKILQEGLITDPNNGPIHSLIAILYIHEEDSVQAN